MTVAAPAPTQGEPRSGTDASGFRAPYRPELEGLRAVAILLVAASHLWWGRISGGIDVFLVVSGYLITVTLVIRWVRTGEVGAIRYLRSLGARLIPAMLLVLTTIAVATWVLLESRPSLASDVLRGAGWAALFGENWYLAIATDGYLSEDRLLNPSEHFWALSMQVQFYLAWLLVVALLAFALRRGSSPTRRLRVATTTIAAITLASWSWSVVETLRDQPVAYLDTSARIWEFGVGGLLALLGARLVPDRLWGAILGWLGLAMVIGLGFIGDFDPWFPGIASVWPVLGTALVLVGANSGSRMGAHRVLGSKPGVWLGGLAFGLYLWHWPVISALAILQNRRTFTIEEGVIIVLSSLIASWVMKHALEQPWQKWGRRTPWGAVLAAVLAVALGATALVAADGMRARRDEAPAPAGVASADPSPTTEPEAAPDRPAVDYLDGPDVYPDVAALQELLAAAVGWTELPPELPAIADGSLYAYGPPGDGSCIAILTWEEACVVGDADAPRTAVVFGDSIAGSWRPAVRDALGPQWRIVFATRAACPAADVPAYGVTSRDPGWSRECAAVRSELLAGVAASAPDLVLVSSSTRTLDRLESGATGDHARAEWEAGMRRTLDALAASGAEVVVLGAPPLSVDACGTADFEPGGNRCRVPVSENRRIQATAERAAAAASGAAYVETRAWFCTPAGLCPWAVDGVVLRVDSHHLTHVFAPRLAAIMRTALLDAAPQLPDVGIRR